MKSLLVRPVRAGGFTSLVALGATVLALLACKKEEKAPDPVVTAAAEPAAAAPSQAPKAAPAENFAGEYISTWGKVKCSQVLDNVNCLYTYSNGSLDCKIQEEKKLDCAWDENGGSGKARFEKKDNGRLEGTWGRGESYTNGGRWIFTPKKK